MKLFLCLITMLLLAGCAGHSSMSHPQIASEEQFIAEMIPHHQEAVDASRLILSSTTDEEIRDLAQRIIAAQEQEIAQMQQWRDEWYPQSAYTATYTPMMGDLVHASDRDLAYAEGMIMHHEAAVQMAKQAQGVQLRPEVRKLTDNIIMTQQEEITELKLIAGRLS